MSNKKTTQTKEEVTAVNAIAEISKKPVLNAEAISKLQELSLAYTDKEERIKKFLEALDEVEAQQNTSAIDAGDDDIEQNYCILLQRKTEYNSRESVLKVKSLPIVATLLKMAVSEFQNSKDKLASQIAELKI